MTDRTAELQAEFKRAKALDAEWGQRVAKLRDEGLVDCKMGLSVDSMTTTATVVTTVNNVLRLRDAGKAVLLTLDI